MSLLWALGDEQTRRQVLEAFDEAVGGRKASHLGRGPLARGSMVVLEAVPESDSKFINQIIGLHGQIIEIGDSRVLIDGRSLAEAYLRSAMSMSEVGPVLIEHGHYFMMGDNGNRVPILGFGAP